MAAPDLEWHRLSQAAVKKHVTKGKLFVGVGSGGRSYTGRVDAITDRYVELSNGPHREVVYYDQRMIRFIAVVPPEGLGLSMGAEELPLN